MGRGEKGILGRIVQKFSSVFCCLLQSLQRVVGCQLWFCSYADYSTALKMEKKEALSFSSHLKSMMHCNSCYLGLEWLQFSSSSSDLLMFLLGGITQQLLLLGNDVPLDLGVPGNTKAA